MTALESGNRWARHGSNLRAFVDAAADISAILQALRSRRASKERRPPRENRLRLEVKYVGGRWRPVLLGTSGDMFRDITALLTLEAFSEKQPGWHGDWFLTQLYAEACADAFLREHHNLLC